MRTSKVLVGSAMAIAAAMQIGVGGTASAAEPESLSVAAAAVDGKGNLLVDVLYTCNEGPKRKGLTVVVEGEATKDKNGKETPGVSGMGQAPSDDEPGEAADKALKCDGSEQRRTVTVMPDEEGTKFPKPGKGTVTVAFKNDIQFNTKHSGLQWISEPVDCDDPAHEDECD
ncbi:hypothetical protein ACFYO1_29810 [Nocardia sp. NPDC006044]|uniref:hypothetical protein n=1 Tax=Nocardia sp. NPDC006044 TaxID=3364306 RepID=UPI00367C6E15